MTWEGCLRGLILENKLLLFNDFILVEEKDFVLKKIARLRLVLSEYDLFKVVNMADFNEETNWDSETEKLLKAMDIVRLLSSSRSTDFPSGGFRGLYFIDAFLQGLD